MTLQEAQAQAARYNAMPDCEALPARILPASVDPITDGDNGWDCEVRVQADWEDALQVFGS